MKSNYKPTHEFLAYVVLFSLFLQSCGGFSNPPVLRLNQAKGQEKARSFIQRENIFAVVGQEFTTEKGYLVTFHEQDGNLAADVKIDSNQQKPNYTNVPVVVAKDTRLSELLYSELLYLEKTIQKRRIQVERSSRGRPSRIVIVRGGLKGGMMEGDEEKGEEKEQKGEIGSSANNNSGLLERALNGDAEAQFQLGNNLYYIWRYQYDDQAGKDAKLWLTRAAEQQHQQAISLLNIIDEIAVEIGADSELKKLLLDCARLNLNKVLPIILKQEININRNLFLGRGTFGDVFQATYQGKTVAIKEIKGIFRTVLMWAL